MQIGQKQESAGRQTVPIRCLAVIDRTTWFHMQSYHMVSHAKLASTTGDLLWQVEPLGLLASTITVDGNRLFVGAISYSGRSGTINCLDGKNGNTLWKKTLKGCVISSTPALSKDGTVAFGTQFLVEPPTPLRGTSDPQMDGEVLCLSSSDGNILWRTQVPGGVVGPGTLDNRGRFYIGSCCKEALAFDMRDGTIIWRSACKDNVDQAPAITDAKVFFCDEGGHVYCFEADEGRLLWERSLTDSALSGVSLCAKSVYVNGRDGQIYALRQDTGAIIWTRKIGASISGCPAIFDERFVLVGNSTGKVVCMDVASGKVVWESRGEGEVGSVMISADGLAVIGRSKSEIAVLRCASGKKVWSYPIGLEMAAAPSIVSDGRVVVPIFGGLVVCIK